MKWAAAGLLSLFLGTSAAKAEWLRAESANFIVFSESRESRVREQVSQLEVFHRLLLQMTGTRPQPSPNKLQVFFVRGNAEMRIVAEMRPGVGGFYWATPTAILAVVDESQNRGSWNNHVLFHEYAHHFMFQYRPATYPAWYVEGFAEYMMTATIGDDWIEIGNVNPARVSWLNQGTWMPYEQILAPGARRISPLDLAVYYAQSWLLVHYLFRTPEAQRALPAYLVAHSRGDDPREAFESAFGMRIRDVDREIRAYTRRITMTRMDRADTGAAVPVEISRLPASSDDLLLYQASMSLGQGERRGAAVLAHVRRAAARHNDDYSRRVLAQAELLFGDRAAAGRLLETLISGSPADAELLFLRGMSHLLSGRADEAGRRAHFRAAQPWFARAHRADPDHYPTLFHYAESLSLEPSYHSQNTLNILLLARQLAPQVGSITLRAAEMLLHLDRFEEAEVLLTPLAASVHREEQAATARALLERARARQRPAPAGAEPVAPEHANQQASRRRPIRFFAEADHRR